MAYRRFKIGTKTAGVFSGAEYDVQSDMRLSTRVSHNTSDLVNFTWLGVAATRV